MISVGTVQEAGPAEKLTSMGKFSEPVPNYRLSAVGPSGRPVPTSNQLQKTPDASRQAFQLVKKTLVREHPSLPPGGSCHEIAQSDFMTEEECGRKC